MFYSIFHRFSIHLTIFQRLRFCHFTQNFFIIILSFIFFLLFIAHILFDFLDTFLETFTNNSPSFLPLVRAKAAIILHVRPPEHAHRILDRIAIGYKIQHKSSSCCFLGSGHSEQTGLVTEHWGFLG